MTPDKYDDLLHDARPWAEQRWPGIVIRAHAPDSDYAYVLCRVTVTLGAGKGASLVTCAVPEYETQLRRSIERAVGAAMIADDSIAQAALAWARVEYPQAVVGVTGEVGSGSVIYRCHAQVGLECSARVVDVFRCRTQTGTLQALKNGIARAVALVRPETMTSREQVADAVLSHAAERYPGTQVEVDPECVRTLDAYGLVAIVLAGECHGQSVSCMFAWPGPADFVMALDELAADLGIEKQEPSSDLSR